MWERAHQLVLAIYKNTNQFLKEELFGLTSQIRRSAILIPSNIAEGCGRGSDADFRRFLQIAMGSASELEYQLFLAYELKYLQEITYNDLTEKLIEIKKMLASLIKKLKANS